MRNEAPARSVSGMEATLEAQGLRKRYGSTVAVDGLSFTVRPGVVTGFVGPNGAGKSTTMRLFLGLDAPDAGAALVGSRPYPELASPLREVGALLDAGAFHPGRSAREHLRWLAASNGLPRGRVEEVLDQVGLARATRRRVGGFSLGMAQRLGIAAALLGDPPILLLDEPVNGLDPDGIRWIRGLLRSLASEGRVVLVSSHLMSELEDTADHLIVIGRGRLIADIAVRDLLKEAGGARVTIRTPEAARALALLAEAGATVTSSEVDTLSVAGLEAARIAELAAEHGLRLTELAPQRATLEEAFIRLTRDAVEFSAGADGRS
jgi:ABC-2 type transport system ATP-binding protein